MFAHLSAMVVGALALTSTVAAVPTGETGGTTCPANQSNECCNQYDTVDNLLKSPATLPLGVLQVLLGLPVSALVGVGCVPVVGNTCTQQNVCCPDNQSSSLVFVGCNNVNL